MAKTSIGLESNITAFLSYLLGWISGLIIILIEKDDQFVRFHAMQSIVTFGSLTLLSIAFGSLFFVFGVLVGLINIISLVLWILLMVKAYQGVKFKLPIVGDIAESWMTKI
tara:strand:+ start:1482 stop:1814 length:333 start_codon:yes stop_codon:yes gene_type:complete